MIIDLIRRHKEGVTQDNQRLKGERIFPEHQHGQEPGSWLAVQFSSDPE